MPAPHKPFALSAITLITQLTSQNSVSASRRKPQKHCSHRTHPLHMWTPAHRTEPRKSHFTGHLRRFENNFIPTRDLHLRTVEPHAQVEESAVVLETTGPGGRLQNVETICSLLHGRKEHYPCCQPPARAMGPFGCCSFLKCCLDRVSQELHVRVLPHPLF